ncbi:type 2 DNA topoisomerase 6 subunit B-like [Salvia hispanica]|uniref:type 2 DNA topoisomerase 6 subunit B-like n=1 Tax=Salvia hispanica TaxID=49212 RepID=UPI0020098578|nr:type 2 DNA topoisomerase 6 subunit B-like [Salvia hispanica]
MEVNSVQDILNLLISSAFRRCRMLDDLCRLSVSIKPTRSSVLISVSDTGTGNILEEFSQFEYKNNTVLSGKWDGLLSVMTTRSSDKEIHHLKFDLKEVVASRRLVRLPSVTKSGAKFRQSVFTSFACLMYCLPCKHIYFWFNFQWNWYIPPHICCSSGVLLNYLLLIVSSLHYVCMQILLLKAFKIAIELIVESGGGAKSYLLQNACSIQATNDVNSYNLTLGLEEYVSKHGNKLSEACHSCFSTGKNLKVGSGVACSRENHQNSGQVMEVVIIISNVSMLDQPSCSRFYGRRTEVLYFKDFSPCSMPQSSLEALNSIDWKNYGLVLKSVGDQDGITILEWENLPPCSHIDIALHIYDKQLPCSHSNRTDRYLTRKALKLALSDLKKRNAGTLLSERAVKICNYAPDLAKTISGLIMSSLDLNFKRECFSLLGLPTPEHEKDIVENCIKDKIVSVIATNDNGRRGTKEAPALFEQGPEKAYEGVGEYFDT